MIVSKSQSQATLPEERSRRLTSARLAITSFIIHYLRSLQEVWGHLSEMPVLRQLAEDVEDVDVRCLDECIGLISTVDSRNRLDRWTLADI